MIVGFQKIVSLVKHCPKLYINSNIPNFQIGNVPNFEVRNVPNFEVGNVPNFKLGNCIQSIIMHPGYIKVTTIKDIAINVLDVRYTNFISADGADEHIQCSVNHGPAVRNKIMV